MADEELNDANTELNKWKARITGWMINLVPLLVAWGINAEYRLRAAEEDLVEAKTELSQLETRIDSDHDLLQRIDERVGAMREDIRAFLASVTQ